MKSFLMIATYLTFASTSALAFQAPVQQSANIYKAVISLILSDNGLMFYSIEKIVVTSSYAKAQLVNQDGDCLAIPFEIKTDGLGTIKVEVDKAALAVCN